VGSTSLKERALTQEIGIMVGAITSKILDS